MSKVRCEIENPGGGWNGFSGMGVSITLKPHGKLDDQVVPQKAVSHLVKAGLRVKVLGPAAPEAPVMAAGFDHRGAPVPPKPVVHPAAPAPEEKSEPVDETPSEEASEDPESTSEPESTLEHPQEGEEQTLVEKLVDKYSKLELVELCKKHDLDTSGNKPDLAERLAENKKDEDLGV